MKSVIGSSVTQIKNVFVYLFGIYRPTIPQVYRIQLLYISLCTNSLTRD